MSQSTSFPQALHPAVFCRVNSSARGTSPQRRTIRPRASSGFRECSRRGDTIKPGMPVSTRLGRPCVASRQISALEWVQ